MRRRKSKAWIIILLVILLLGTCGASFYLYKTLNSELETTQDLLTQQTNYITSNTQVLYVSIGDIHKGDILTEGVNVEQRACLTALPAQMYIQSNDLGCVAVVDIEVETPIFTTMITTDAISNDTRELEIGVAQLPLNITMNDYYDLRIRFATGQDYIVASKLRCKSYDLENSIFYTNLSESEILTLSSATVEAYINSGTKIYLTKYEEPNLQDDALPTYPVNDAVYNLIATDPNVLKVAEGVMNQQARLQLKTYLGTMTKAQLEAVTEGEGLIDTAHTAAMSALSNASYADEPSEEGFDD